MIRVDSPRDRVNVAKVYEAGQEQIFEYWDELSAEQRRALLEQIDTVDFQEFSRLVRGLQANGTGQKRDLENLAPIEMASLPAGSADHAAALEAGLETFREGQVGFFLVAGGQGTRLRFDGPKGMYPIAPISEKTLFQLFAEQILAMQRRVKRTLPWFIMTSQANHETTRAFFQEHGYFGLNSASVSFHPQGMLPVVERRRGRILLEERHQIATSPNGHGGAAAVIQSLAPTLEQHGIQHLLYHQVDNPLLHLADPVFLGHHVLSESQFSSKAIAKTDPDEKIGVFCRTANHVVVVEYSELADRERCQRDDDGQLTYRAGNVAAHVLAADLFCPKEGSTAFEMPYHHAYKATPYVRNGEKVIAEEPNAVKFESFLFDALPHSRNPVVLEVSRDEEFAPVKNLEGKDTPETCREALTQRWAGWLAQSGVDVPRNDQGGVAATIEISPLYADSADELKSRVAAGEAKGESIELTAGSELHLD